MAPTTRRFQLQVYIATLFLGLIGLFAAAVLTMEYLKAREILLGAAETRFGHIQREISSIIENRYDTAGFVLDTISGSAITTAPALAIRMKSLPVFTQLLHGRPALSAVHIGYDSGEYFVVRRAVANSPLAEKLNLPSAVAYIVESGERGAVGDSATRYFFYDAALTPVGEQTIPGEVMDPRAQPWFQQAIRASEPIITEPYPFYRTGEMGNTMARRAADGNSVVAIDMTLASLSKQLRDFPPTASAHVAIVDEKGEVLAASDLTDEELVNPLGAADLSMFGARHGPAIGQAIAAAKRASDKPDAKVRLFDLVGVNGSDAQKALVSRLRIPGPPVYVAVAAPEAELLADAISMRNRGLLAVVALVLFAIPLTLACSRLASRPLGALTREAAAIRAFKFDKPFAVRSFITEIDELARTMEGMKSTIQRFLEIGATLASERRFERLLDHLLGEMMQLTGARGGAVYLSEKDGTLRCSLARWQSAVCEITPPVLRPDRDTAHPVIKALAGNAVVAPLSDEEFARWYPGFASEGSPSVLAVALRNRQGIIVGALMLVQDRDARREVQEQEILTLVEALAGTAATAIESQLLYHEQKQLLEALIQLVAGAIDRKSPYTGGHCERVPELVKMIARAAEEATTGPFKDFGLSEDQWQTLHIAAWLHDCGKVTTPEYVVDKATKLETIYDRLHEIRMRFEVLKREAEVTCWQAIAAGEPSAVRLAELRALLDVLDEEFAFVAECNEGGEFMAPDKIERLRRIAERTWTRTLDDRIGLGPEEQRRKNGRSAALPAKEPLLADKPEHIFIREPRDTIAADNPWGFKIPVPEHLYNRGEIHNLAIGRGTLSNEDRYKINEHIVETIRMLSRLPWPRHLEQVVEIAGGHHERMDGKGYPRQLNSTQMSVPARMMAVADIFEALTAGDRPYKKAKTLSQALGIMSHMRDEGHIDGEIFELFVSTGVYAAYAARFLDRQQIDAVDPARYMPS